jgi:hypothetical protein
VTSILKGARKKQTVFQTLIEKITTITVLSGLLSLTCYLIAYYYKEGYLTESGLSIDWFPVEPGTISPRVIDLLIRGASEIIPESVIPFGLWIALLATLSILYAASKRASDHLTKIRPKSNNGQDEPKGRLSTWFRQFVRSEYFPALLLASFGPLMVVYLAVVVILLFVLVFGVPANVGKKDAIARLAKASECKKIEGENTFPCVEVYKDQKFLTAGVVLAKSNTDFAIFDARTTTTFPIKDCQLKWKMKK